jgi:hypothetical protein
MKLFVLLAILMRTVSASASERHSSSHCYHSRLGSSSSTRSTHRSSGSHVRSTSRFSHHHSGYGSHRPRRASGIAREGHGRIQRSRSDRARFRRKNLCPSNGRRSGACPGYVVDRVRPLECGGVDSPGNMQCQTTAAKAKDRTKARCL